MTNDAEQGERRWRHRPGGELLGLERKDVDLLHRVVHVRRQAQEIQGRRIVTEPKTEAGIRTAALPSALVQILSQHLDTFSAASAEGTVFTGQTGRPVRRADLSDAWRAALAATGLSGVRIHDLRHRMAVKRLLAWHAENAEVDAKLPALATYLGHRDPRSTYVYLSATPELLGHAARLLEASR